VQPLGQTVRVAADADEAPTTLLMVRVEAIRERVSKLRTSFTGNLPIGLKKGDVMVKRRVIQALKLSIHSLSK
jgi:hypothetical protein